MASQVWWGVNMWQYVRGTRKAPGLRRGLSLYWSADQIRLFEATKSVDQADTGS